MGLAVSSGHPTCKPLHAFVLALSYMAKSMYLRYSPGALPSRPGPEPGTEIKISVLGSPPIKTVNQSIRNATHSLHERFLQLREAGIAAMDGRAWARNPSVGILAL